MDDEGVVKEGREPAFAQAVRAHARDQGSFLPLTVAIARPKARPQRGERAIATVRGRKTSGLLGGTGGWGVGFGGASARSGGSRPGSGMTAAF